MNAIQDTRDSAARLFRDYGGAILIAVLVALTIRFFVIEAYRIPSQAMRPNLEPGDTIFVSKSAYGIRNPFTGGMVSQPTAPRAGDIVVFEGVDDPDRDFIKRVVGIPGDTVEIRAGKLWVNGKDTTSSSSPHSACGRETLGPGRTGESNRANDSGRTNAASRAYDVCWEPPLLSDMAPLKVPEGSVYTLGDLRTRVVDTARPDGSHVEKKNGAGVMVPFNSLKGRALWIWLSIEPHSPHGEAGGLFSRIRFERMFKKIL